MAEARRRRQSAAGRWSTTTRPSARTTPWSATDSAARTFCSTRSTVSPLLVAQPAQHAMICGGDHRREAERGLVEQQQPRPRDQGPAEREHLPLATGQLVARMPAARARAAGTARRPRRSRRGRVGLVPAATAPPSRRFSATVSSVITPPPSGTWARPRRHQVLGATARMSAPSSRPARACGRTRPDRVRSRVVLPAPFAPSTAAMLAGGTSRSSSSSTGARGAVPGGQSAATSKQGAMRSVGCRSRRPRP